MKLFLISLLMIIFINSYASSIKGTVHTKNKNLFGKTLFIIAKPFGSKRPMPLAVKKIEKVKFPLSFELTQADVMIPETPFKGPLQITVRISPSGNAMDKTGPSTTTKKPIKVGFSNLTINL